ncbi:hypothetical protein QR680_004655 [Steinernema hermaphroditum]|uniref:CX domain-containing protein n=1 Tax=Steinernema hermaphroditum TaxID=289476 RepID=A0AA39HRP0_9BILA|nr:hypothetical protein QR680_004655 [Steinernema hermaphroditum]
MRLAVFLLFVTASLSWACVRTVPGGGPSVTTTTVEPTTTTKEEDDYVIITIYSPLQIEPQQDGTLRDVETCQKAKIVTFSKQTSTSVVSCQNDQKICLCDDDDCYRTQNSDSSTTLGHICTDNYCTAASSSLFYENEMSIPNSQLPYSPPYNPQMATAPPPPGFVDRPIFSPPPPYTPPGAKLPGPTADESTALMPSPVPSAPPADVGSYRYNVETGERQAVQNAPLPIPRIQIDPVQYDRNLARHRIRYTSSGEAYVEEPGCVGDGCRDCRRCWKIFGYVFLFIAFLYAIIHCAAGGSCGSGYRSRRG